MALATVNLPKYATVLNGSVGVLGTGASTVGATAINIDGIAEETILTGCLLSLRKDLTI